MNIPPGFAQANLLYGGVGAPRGAQNAFGVQVEGAGTTPLQVAEDIYAAWSSTMLQQLDDDLNLLGVKVKLGPNDVGADATFFGTNNGGVASTAVSPQVSLLVKKVTGSGGRVNRGRMFIPGIVENWVDGSGVVPSGVQDTADTALLSFMNGLAASNFIVGMVILHNAVELVPTPVLSLKTDGRVATQRRRLRKVGGRRATIGA